MAVKQGKRNVDAVYPVIFIVAFLLFSWSTLEGLAARWVKWDETFSHGFLLLAISAVLSVKTWWRLHPKVGFYWVWLLPFIAALLLHLSGSILRIETFQQLAFVPVLLGGLALMWGWRQIIPFIVPVGLLVFALPFWEYLEWPLQVVTVNVNELMLSPLNIEFIVEGVFVYFPGVGAFEIANGCSGLRYLLVGLTLCVLYGELNLNAWKSRFLLIAAGVALALAANWIRVFVILHQGYETNMTSSLVEDHDMFGWWVFAATLIPVFLFARYLEKKEAGAPQGGVGDTQRPSQVQGRPLFGVLSTIVPMLLIGGFTWYSMAQFQSPAQSAAAYQEFTAVDEAHWLPVFQKQLAGWQPHVQRPDRSLERTYVERGSISSAGARKQLFVGLYSYDFQRPGREVVQYYNRLFSNEKLMPESTFKVDAGNGVEMGGLSLRYRQSEQRIHIAYGYYVEGQWKSTELQAKLAQLPGIFNARSDASLLVLGIVCQSCDPKQALSSLAGSISGEVEPYLDSLYR
ncbi:exosortase [Marinobacter fonticola]|uniref:exosortase n=1 Tax=Marinobacter fonticola TaxID=2603215 RepID=UPI00143DB511|nr:exosortase [Marinobacter fonticola]